MYPKIIIGGATLVSTYSVCLAIGIIAMFLLFLLYAKKVYKIPEKQIYTTLELFMFALIVGGVFGMLFDALFKIPENNAFVLGGSTFYGGLIGGLLAFCVLYKIFKRQFTIPCITLLDILSPFIVLAHFFGRLGCFFAGCCFGRPTNSWLGIYYPEGSEAFKMYGNTKLIPSPLLEALGLVIIFLLLMLVFKKYKLYIYFILYGIIRFVLEFFRGDTRGTLFGPVISPAQVISIILVIFGTIMIIRNSVRAKIDRKKHGLYKS